MVKKKKKTCKSIEQEFTGDPFSNLKGFSVSDSSYKALDPPILKPSHSRSVGTFVDEMEKLGVERLKAEGCSDEEPVTEQSAVGNSKIEDKNQKDEDLFIAAINGFSVRFEDSLSEECDTEVKAVPRRMKQLKKGQLTPDASLDLHGCLRAEVIEKLRFFIKDAQYQGWKTLLVITGKGLHSEDGTSVLRDETEQFLAGAGKNFVVEWGRAPRQYGGDGALILFLRNS